MIANRWLFAFGCVLALTGAIALGVALGTSQPSRDEERIGLAIVFYAPIAAIGAAMLGGALRD
ncbi:MAG: hypothetical protein ACYSU0_11400 [Planctomycetota bacterium]|jgi:hypothetical protein